MINLKRYWLDFSGDQVFIADQLYCLIVLTLSINEIEEFRRKISEIIGSLKDRISVLVLVFIRVG